MLLLPIGITEVFTGTPKNKRPPRRLSDLKEVFLGDDWKNLSHQSSLYCESLWNYSVTKFPPYTLDFQEPFTTFE